MTDTRARVLLAEAFEAEASEDLRKFGKTFTETNHRAALRAIQNALDQSPSPDAEAMREAAVKEVAAPWADHHGPLPHYDHPLASVFDSGVEYAVNLLATNLGVTDWQPCDGTEEYDGDLGGTLMNIVLAAMPKDEQGDPIWPRDLQGPLPTLSLDNARDVTPPSSKDSSHG